jgi:hypothetical protein
VAGQPTDHILPARSPDAPTLYNFTSLRTKAIIRQGTEIWAGIMLMLSANDAKIERNVTIMVDGNFEMDAQGRCSIARSVSITAGSTSGSWLE